MRDFFSSIEAGSSRFFCAELPVSGTLLFIKIGCKRGFGDTFIQIEPYKVRAIDTNGAGDMFSGAFLYAITHGHSYAEAGKLASLASSKVVAQWGPRPQPEQIKKVLGDLLG